MAGRLSTHVLDLGRGGPAAGVAVALWRIEGAARQLLAQAVTNADGRTDAPLLAGDQVVAGVYELVFGAGDYLAATGQAGGFLGEVPIRFAMQPGQHYHVPLLLSAHGYSTYRGS